MIKMLGWLNKKWCELTPIKKTIISTFLIGAAFGAMILYSLIYFLSGCWESGLVYILMSFGLVWYGFSKARSVW